MNIEHIIIGFLEILFASVIIFFLPSQRVAVSIKKVHSPVIEIKSIRSKSIMWNH